MHLLVLGGTGFVGRHIVEAALDRGHEVTLFNRGTTNPGVFPDVRTLKGDRESGDLAALDRGEWDAVVDVNAYIPRHVREATERISGRVGHYTFISTVSVYEPTASSIDESSAVLGFDDPADASTETVDGRTYGPLKVLCERAVEAAFPGATTVIRPGIVAGPWDPSDRFTYWVRRVASASGPILAPARAGQPVQLVHGRDQGDLVVTATENARTGVFNSTGPSQPLTFAGLLAACAQGAGVELADVVWVDDGFARAHRLDLPLALPADGSFDGLFRASSSAAQAAGLVNRDIAETVRDTLEWDARRDHGIPLVAGPTREREAELVAAHRGGGQPV